MMNTINEYNGKYFVHKIQTVYLSYILYGIHYDDDNVI